MLDARIVTVERDGLRVAALDWGGDGAPLLLLHPNGLGAGFFEPLAVALRDTFRPVAVDLRGHGGTDAPASRDGVYESYRTRPPFDAVAPEALAAYVRWGFVDRPDGQVELACAPDVEATIFEVSGEPTGAPAAWRHLDQLTATAVLACGDHSELPEQWFAAQAEHAGAPLVTVPGGHFFLHEDTARAAKLVREHLA